MWKGAGVNKMRLIDADALRHEFDEKCMEECACCDEAACKTITKYGHKARLFDHCGLIDRAQTVETITEEKIKTIVERVTQAVIDKQVEASIEISPDNVHISINPWKPYEMKCPYGK